MTTPEARRQAPQPDSYANIGITLATNRTLKTIVRRLQTTPPDWDAISTRVRTFSPNIYADEQLRGFLGDIYVDRVIAETAQSPSLAGHIDLEPIPDETETTNYRFRQGHMGNVIVYRGRTPTEVAEYDGFFEADGLPVVCEVKITTNTGKRGYFTEALSARTIRRKFAPLEEYYREYGKGTRFGYMVVTTKDTIHKNTGVAFKRYGGTVVGLPVTLADFTQRAEKFRRTEGLALPRSRREPPSRPTSAYYQTF